MAISTINQAGLTAPLTLTAPNLGTPSAINLSNATGVPASALPSGSVIQTIYSLLPSTSGITTTSTSFVTTGHTLTITPRYSTSKILLTVSAYCYNTYTGWGSAYTIYRNGSNVVSVAGNTVLGGQRGDSNSNPMAFNMNLMYVDSPASTSAQTYTVYVLSNNATNTTYYPTAAGSFVGSSVATLVAQEISG